MGGHGTIVSSGHDQMDTCMHLSRDVSVDRRAMIDHTIPNMIAIRVIGRLLVDVWINQANGKINKIYLYLT